MLDFYASERHYLDHLANVWLALESEFRGIFWVKTQLLKEHAESLNITAEIGSPTKQLTVVASYVDYRKTSGKVIYMEHGIGHSYSNTHPSYAGGSNKNRVVLFLCQHSLTAEKNKKAYPNAKVEIIGTPKLDNIKRRGIKGRTVALSWHWDCHVSPETRSSLSHFRPLIKLLQEASDIELIGHAHPKPSFNNVMRRYYADLGVEYVDDFNEVLDRADLYVIDNSSTAYEFAAAGRPVIHLNAPWYRKEINHGIRFWDYLPGPTADTVEEAIQLVQLVLDNPELYEPQRREVVLALYPFLGNASKQAVKAIKEFVNQRTANA